MDQISFQVKTGEIVGFLGPNGAGKSTTMKIITCYMAPTSGTVMIGNLSIDDDADEIKKLIGYLPENNPLYHEMYMIDYLEFVAALQSVPRKQIPERVHEMVRVCGLDAEKHKRIGELSKGFRQRVGLAQAMIHDPQILILDEPTSGLDPNQIVEIRKLIRELGKEKTVILSTHILPEVEATCDRIMIINNGKIAADGTAESLRKQAKGQEVIVVEILEADRNTIIKAVQEMETVALIDPVIGKENTFEVQSITGASSRRAIFELCVKNNWVLTQLTPIETRLEDIFRDLTITN